MNQQEALFFEWFDKIQAIADANEVSVYTVVNARQIWDAGFEAGRDTH